MGIHYNKGTAELIDYVKNKEDFQYEMATSNLAKTGLGVAL